MQWRLDCLEDCALHDRLCMNDCFELGSQVARDAVDALSACLRPTRVRVMTVCVMRAVLK